MSRELNVVGKVVRDTSSFRKLTGEAKFNNDVQLPGMLHGKLLKSPHARAKVLNVDVSKAMEIEGVYLIMTKDNFPFLFHDEVRFTGQDVACVISKDIDTSNRAKRLIEVEYEVLPSVIDPYEAKKEGSAIALPGMDTNIVPYPNDHLSYKYFKDPDENGIFQTRVSGETDFDGYGDLEKEKENVDVFVSGEGYNHAKAYAPLMATSGAVANYSDGMLDVYLPSQFSSLIQFTLAAVFKLPQSKINIITEVTGGGFGGRLSSGVESSENETSYTIVACAASMALGKPVRVFYSRQEEFYYYWSRSGMDTKAEIGFKKDGTIVTMDTEVWRNVSTLGFNGLHTQAFDVTATGNMLYSHNCKASRHRKFGVATNNPVFVGWQGFGNPEVFLAVESVMDIAAEKLGIDPIELRKKNHMRGGDNFLEVAYMWSGGHTLGHTGISDCIDQALKEVDWDSRDMPNEKEGTLRHGVGMSLHCQQNGGEGLMSNTIVKLHSDGTAVLFSNYQDIGQGGRTAQMQMVAESLGIGLDKVSINADETKTTTYTHYNSCSSGTFIIGNGTHKAVEDAKRQLFEAASKVMKIPVESLDTKDGIIFPLGEGKDKGIPWIVAFQNSHTVDPYKVFMADTIVGKGKYIVEPGPMPSEQGATFIELDVDTETGKLENIKVTISQDCGKALNPRVVEAHYLGVHHGIEALTSAEQILDKNTGKVLNDNFIDYGVATILDYEVNPIIVENPDPTTPYGAVGIGQAFMNGLGAAMSNAIYNAVGVRMKETPFTPAKILSALGKI
ncbi:MAG: xanthine dehydrogenase family protein molybdopterin-binding subunit [Firmicutes bacterium]|nr:xanthine dehydrogenase family protein molybdopterin-binding subunit [Bacillota bacterium]